jgi:hypothetical protein
MMLFGLFALTSKLTFTPAATVLERAAGNFFARDLCNLIAMVIVNVNDFLAFVLMHTQKNESQ